MAVFCVNPEIKRHVDRKIAIFFIPHAFDDAFGGLRWYGMSGYPTVKEFDDTFSRIETIPACDGQTDRQTDILRQHSPRYAHHRAAKMYDSVFLLQLSMCSDAVNDSAVFKHFTVGNVVKQRSCLSPACFNVLCIF